MKKYRENALRFAKRLDDVVETMQKEEEIHPNQKYNVWVSKETFQEIKKWIKEREEVMKMEIKQRELGIQIKKLLLDKGKKQYELAKELGISKSTISRLLAGKVGIDWLQLQAIAKFLDEPIGTFASEKEEK